MRVSPRDSRRDACSDSTRTATHLPVSTLLLAPVADLAAVTVGKCTAIHTWQVSCGPPVRHAPRPRYRRGDGGEVRTGSSTMWRSRRRDRSSSYSTVGQEPSGANAAVATAWGDPERLGRARPRGFAPRNCRDLNSVQTDQPTTRFTRASVTSSASVLPQPLHASKTKNTALARTSTEMACMSVSNHKESRYRRIRTAPAER